ncbi:MAG TPA: hypothetical protein DIU35_18430 [Candidatus Latescibacteria bacterium]|nr:hypothetical protein [Gemmatimonadota bacterium]HCR19460.1 hypothetical protein [Candidatus Latescibacterota bacterium]|tara:strand:- start:1976 stop:2299 length:324 start_codon:yes stop_codon:yes gene_type:complete
MAFKHRDTFGERYVSLDPFRLTGVIDTVDSRAAFGVSNGFQFGLYFGFEEIWVRESSDVDSDEDVAELLDIFESGPGELPPIQCLTIAIPEPFGSRVRPYGLSQDRL